MSGSWLLHNPRCSKSRAALALLETHGAAFEVVHYLDTPPTEAQLRSLLAQLGIPARGLLRTGEGEYAELGLAERALDDDAVIAAMVRHPRLIERPVFVRGGRAVIGRPPERVLELLGDQA